MGTSISGFISNLSLIDNTFHSEFDKFFPVCYGFADGYANYRFVVPYSKNNILRHRVEIGIEKDYRTSLGYLAFGVIRVEGVYSGEVLKKVLNTFDSISESDPQSPFIRVGLNGFKVPKSLQYIINQQK
jgi:hypothetical protein